jgi:vanillate O-demethylase monooxygenase subunit
MWLRNAWYVVAARDELVPDALLARTVIGQPLVLYRAGNGAVVALEDRCCHRLAPLSKGRREGDDLRCMYHGMKFAPDGRCVEIPGQSAIPAEARVGSYPVRESGAWVWVWMGEQAADPALLPVTIAPEDDGWRIAGGHLDYDAHYQLINDNLLDLSHLSFTHEHTLGRDTPGWAGSRPRLVRLARGVRFRRWLPDYRHSRHLGHLGTQFDLWHHYDFLVPGIFIQRSAWYALGTAARLDNAPPEAPALFERCDEQAVTPATANTARYWYTAGVRRDDADDAYVARQLTFTERAFNEDKAIIEAQQRVIDLDPAHPMLPTSFDAGPTTFRRLLAQLVEQEQGAAKAASG